MFKRICLLGLILLSSCDNSGQQNTGTDGYEFGTKQYERNTVLVNVVTYHSQTEFNKALRENKLDSNVVAFTILKPPFDACTIHMIDPAIKYQPEFIGHEFVHCMYGQWHSNNSSRK